MKRVLHRIRTEEGGFSLIELMMVCAVLSVILAAVLMMLVTTNKIAPKDEERSQVLQETQVGVHKMTRELRHAYQVDVADPWRLEVRSMVNGVSTQIGYDCSDSTPGSTNYRQCNRYIVGSATRVPVIQRVLLPTPAGGGAPAPIFEYRRKDPANPASPIVYVRVRVRVSPAGERNDGYQYPLVFDDGFYMRNADV